MSNSEIEPGGGVGAMRFDVGGNIVDAYRILEDTRRNCSGGATHWNTWLSYEEVGYGYAFETDLRGAGEAVRGTRWAASTTKPRRATRSAR
ncbi:alkaline phosphatase PhoX [Saccharopolyspora hattusasensis]|uniref:alkaline phosphatase PhoX n=1 Tax=Saccharopolyspora hattusasensis TaxID=1128679 RepID=UPI003D975EAD